MRIGIQASYSGGFRETAAEIRDLESAGLDLAMVAEVYTFDAVSQLGYLAAVTERLELMSGIFPIYSRTPALTAMTAAGLDFVSGGRFTLGLGASGPQVIEGWHGVPYDAPLQRTREIVEICRQVWRRERLAHEGPKYTIPLPPEQGTGLGKPLKLINTPVRERIPVLLAALGPKNVELAAEIAEAWEPIFFVPEKAASVWGQSLATGRAKRDAALGELQVVTGVPVAIGDDAEGMLDLVRPSLALYIGGMGARGKNFYNDLARRYGYEDEARTIQDLYLDGKKDEAAAAVPEELVRATSLIGPESYVAERVAAFREAGVTTLMLQPLDDSRESRLRTVETMRRITDR
ncbi:LLM class F420-dependent oxidoreductase [Geodermatophilus sabuli]|uniref:Probable F420-dependent oxidoreductase, Rv3520c family n=1 Tax=Geodermatophilus sabuli TaxID=1564158 RepID=A0A285E956_9ACTN|nr:LLM class F420-dependent oxidoreductase [Geodermatophilus sabuli]MBB3084934.1 F420-dependent oxidoreductase-like protein [Geodermatophilus sabuli]SNX95658.1 probable F420-dependent oxidoreductase, Rv3520c family [Geodermatophilus sabuli]